MWSVGLNQVSLKIDSDRKDTLFFRDVQENTIAIVSLMNGSNVWCLELIRGEANKDKKRLLFYTNFGIDIGKSKT